MKPSSIALYSIIAIAISWSIWVWVRYPAPKTPNDKQVIAALTKQFEKLKEQSYGEGYDLCAYQVEADRAIQHAWGELEKKGVPLDPLRPGQFTRPIAK